MSYALTVEECTRLNMKPQTQQKNALSATCQHKFFVEQTFISDLYIDILVCGKCGYSTTRVYVDWFDFPAKFCYTGYMHKEIQIKRLWVNFGYSFKGIGLGFRIDKYHLNVDFLFFWFGIEF